MEHTKSVEQLKIKVWISAQQKVVVEILETIVCNLGRIASESFCMWKEGASPIERASWMCATPNL